MGHTERILADEAVVASGALALAWVRTNDPSWAADLCDHHAPAPVEDAEAEARLRRRRAQARFHATLLAMSPAT